MITEKQFNTSENELNYAEGPSTGPPLLLLHGTSHRWQSFLPVILGLSVRWHIYAPDFRGHGASERTECYGFGYYIRDTVRFLGKVIGEPAVIFGHSLGGRVALKIAADYPQLVKAIILGDSSLSDPVPSDRTAKAFNESIKLLEEHQSVNEIYEEFRRRQGDEFDPVSGLIQAKNYSLLDIKMLRSIADNSLDLDSPGNHSYGYKPSEHVAKVSCPVLILQAEYGMLNKDEIEKALEILPEAYYFVLKNAPHEFPTRPSDPLLKALTAFLEAVR
jgi:pimeloyl-ACP methyl ester carboxylesterase